MSAFNVDGSLVTDDPVRLTANTATTVYTATGAVPISSIIVTPTSGTPNLTIQIHNGSTAYNLRTAVAMTAGTAFIWDELFILPALYTIKITSSAAGGDMDVFVTHGSPAAARLRV